MNRIKEMEKEPYVQIPSKLISEVTRAVRVNDSESYAHYAFSFLVLNSFLYKYANYINISNKTYINMSDMKEILKYNAKNQKLDIVTRKDTGILEQEGFVETTTDIPISYELTDDIDSVYKDRKIIRTSDVDDSLRNYLYSDILRTPNYCTYIPTFMMDSEKGKGALNDYKGTFRLNYSEFEYFMFNDDFTLRDFFIYCYIKSSTKKNRVAKVTYDTYKRQTGMSKSTVRKIVNKLEDEKVINISSSGNSSYRSKNPNAYSIRKDFEYCTGI